MAVTQPGGAGTTIFVYDNAHGDAGGDGSYSFADIKAAMDILRPGQSDIEYLVGAITGLPFSVTRRGYLLNVSVQLGGSGADGTNPTTLKDTNVDVFFRVGAILYRLSAGPIETRLGTKTGAGPLGLYEPTAGGRDGCTLFFATGMTFRNDFYLYGNRIQCLSGVLTFSSTGASVQEFWGNTTISAGANNVMGTGTFLGSWYNNTFIFTTSSTAINGFQIQDGRGNRLITVTPIRVVAGINPTSRIQGLNISGVPSTSYIGPTGGSYSDWMICDVAFQDDAPRFSFTSDATPDNGLKEFSRLQTKLCGQDGAGLIDVPIRLYSSVVTDAMSGDGLVVNTKTFGEGDLGFTHGASGFQNGVQVRDWYRSGGVVQFRDRVFTMFLNVAGGAFAVRPDLESRKMVFQWPGRDVFKGSYQKDGGTFQRITAPIMLKSGSPSSPVLLEECSL